MKNSADEWAQSVESFNPFSQEAIHQIVNQKLELKHWKWVDGSESSETLSPGKKFSKNACIHPVDDDGYQIPISELQDADGVIRWSRQLLGKSWMSAELFYEFWELIHQAFLRNSQR